MTALTGVAALRQPLARLERARWTEREPDTTGAPPVIIVGHWRSGTTHLGNILAKSGRFAYVDPIAAGLPNELLSIGRSLRGLLERSVPSDRLIDQVPVTHGSPQEDEFALANMQGLSFLHALYFPQHFDRWVDRGLFHDGCSQTAITHWEQAWTGYLAKLQRAHGRQRLLLRNPMFTARLPQLLRLIPDLRIIHIHRHPLAILRSMRNYYRKLFGALAWQSADHVDIDRTIIRVYQRMMQRLITDSRDLPADRFIDIAYDDLDRDALGTVSTIYERFSIPGFARDQSAFQAYLDSISDFTKNSFAPDPADAALVAKPWAPFLDHWGYDLNAHT